MILVFPLGGTEWGNLRLTSLQLPPPKINYRRICQQLLIDPHSDVQRAPLEDEGVGFLLSQEQGESVVQGSVCSPFRRCLLISVLTTDGLVPGLPCVFSKITKCMHIPTRSFFYGFVFPLLFFVDNYETFDLQVSLCGPVQYNLAEITTEVDN